MTRKVWRDKEISAYVDGRLALDKRQRLEAAMAQSPALRARVTAMQQMVALVKAPAFRDPPRNYLLTPAMVAEPKPARPAPRPVARPLWVMRLTTAITAAAFVLSLGLNLLGGLGMARPAMYTASDEHGVVMFDMRAMDDEALPVIPEAVVEDDVPVPEMGIPPDADPLTEPLPADEVEFALLEDDAPPTDDDMAAMAGDVEDGITPPEALAPPAAPEPPTEAPPPEAMFPPRWVTFALGLLTLALGGVTFRLSRQT